MGLFVFLPLAVVSGMGAAALTAVVIEESGPMTATVELDLAIIGACAVACLASTAIFVQRHRVIPWIMIPVGCMVLVFGATVFVGAVAMAFELEWSLVGWLLPIAVATTTFGFALVKSAYLKMRGMI